MASSEPKLENSEKIEEKELLAPKSVKIIDPVEAQLTLGECKEDDPAMSRIALRVYPRRWLVLLIVALLNNANTMTWISFAPVANHVDIFYHHANATNYFSIVYMLCTIPVGIFAMWAGRHFGLRWAILVAAWANGIGAAIRFSSSFVTPEYRFIVGITGQGIAALAYPFIMFLPTKVAAAWFPDNQRGLATTIGVMANPLGVLLANLISPRVVTDPSHLIYLNAVIAMPGIIICILATLVINRSEPKLPPTVSAGQPYFEFLKGLQVCFTSREYILLLLVMGGGIGMFNCLYTIIQQLLCPSGYSNTFSGTCAALMIIGGVCGATAAGIFVDKTKKYEEAMKVSMALAVVFGLGFLQLVLHRDLPALILIDCFLFGVFGLASYPVGLELSAECTFPVSETTSTGLIVLSGQVQSVIYLSVMTVFSKPLQPDYMKYQVCSLPNQSDANSVTAKDMTFSVIVMSIIASLLVLILVIFFHPKYRRMEAEKGLNMTNTNKNGLKAAEEPLDNL
ncbi:major facilitator superfamily domain-containing protein [Ditylenchus destructor]|nr:major facilitator superfamily domain-containing protein [Ditylenchus destructor]